MSTTQKRIEAAVDSATTQHLPATPQRAAPVRVGGAALIRNCRRCGTLLVRPRRNQRYCSKLCSDTHAKQIRAERRRARNDARQRRCPMCDQHFTVRKGDQKFCSRKCMTAFHNHWKAWGPRMGLMLMKWRVARTPGAFTELCSLFADAVAELDAKKGEADASP